MSAITDNDIVSRFEKLSLTKPEILEHAPVANGAQWKAELEKLGKGNVTLTKTVCPLLILDQFKGQSS
jgi:prolyl-tRNA synthetase